MFLSLRLADTKSSVLKALADDFDTPRAVSAVMNLVHHGNCQLQPVSTVTHCAHMTPVRLDDRQDELYRITNVNHQLKALTVRVTVCVLSVRAWLGALQCLERWSATSQRSWMCSGSICCTLRSEHLDVSFHEVPDWLQESVCVTESNGKCV